MLSEGAAAPRFELPALVDGEKGRVQLSEYLGDDVVILAFYPADFNPACDAESCDLDELDLFTMQKDVTILGISPDSVYSHRAFADQYDLKIPLLSDTDGEVADAYDIGLVDDIGQHLIERAVAVVDHDGEIQYSWSTDDTTTLPRVDEIKDALAETGGDDTAFARYRVGHAHYTEGRRAFTSAMNSFQNTEWMMAQRDFKQAREEFEEAADQFDTAVRFADDESLVPLYEGANEKATALWQAADWLTRSASAYSSGSGSEGQDLRDDAEGPLETVRQYAEPPDPDEEWPPERDNLSKDQTEDHSILPSESDAGDAELDVDIDAEMGGVDDEQLADLGDADHSETANGELSDLGEAEADEPATAASGDASADEQPVEDDIDDDELAEIQAELAANNPDSEPSVDELAEESTAIVEAPPMGDESATEADGAAGEVDGEAADQSDPSVAGVADGPAEEAVDEPVPDAAETTDESAGEGTERSDGDAVSAPETAVAQRDDSMPDRTEPAGGATDDGVTEPGSDPDDTVADAGGSDVADGADEDAGFDADDSADEDAGSDADGADEDAGSDADDSGDEDAESDADDATDDLEFELAEPDPPPLQEEIADTGGSADEDSDESTDGDERPADSGRESDDGTLELGDPQGSAADE